MPASGIARALTVLITTWSHLILHLSPPFPNHSPCPVNFIKTVFLAQRMKMLDRVGTFWIQQSLLVTSNHREKETKRVLLCVMGVKSYAEVLTLGTCEWDLIWKSNFWKCNIVMMRSTDFGWDLNLMPVVLTTRSDEAQEQRRTRGECYRWWQRQVWDDSAASKGKPRIDSHHQKPGTGKEIFSLRASRRIEPCQHLYTGLIDSRTVRK